MDFLKNMKAKLEEFEREAQRAMQEQQERQQALFQAKAEQGKPQSQRPAKKQESYPRGGGKQDPNKRRSRQPVDSDSCPVEEGRRDSEFSEAPSADSWILDDLEGRLDEAFLLQEVLGSPRCVRGWDD